MCNYRGGSAGKGLGFSLLTVQSVFLLLVLLRLMHSTSLSFASLKDSSGARDLKLQPNMPSR